jgi:hypothetical protein
MLIKCRKKWLFIICFYPLSVMKRILEFSQSFPAEALSIFLPYSTTFPPLCALCAPCCVVLCCAVDRSNNVNSLAGINIVQMASECPKNNCWYRQQSYKMSNVKDPYDSRSLYSFVSRHSKNDDVLP